MSRVTVMFAWDRQNAQARFHVVYRLRSSREFSRRSEVRARPLHFNCGEAMVRDKVIIHIGFHKTATSAVQEYCAGQRERLLANGVWYPQSLGDCPGHQELAWVLMTEQPPWADRRYDPLQVKRHYAAQLAARRGTPMLLSSEEFCREPELAARDLHELFADAEVRIVAYVREPFDFLVSRYLHEVIYGESRPFPAFVRAEMASADLATRLSPWIDIFGRDLVVVRAYSHEMLEQRGIVGDLLSLFGVDEIDAQSSEQIVNAGVAAELGSLFAYLNRCPLPPEERQRSKDVFLAASKSARELAPIPKLRDFYLDQLGAFELDFLERCRNSLAKHFDIRF